MHARTHIHMHTLTHTHTHVQVRLTHVPEYFDFWQGKPLRERDFGVKVQKRKAWQRPKSDYGNRLATRNKNKENDDSTSGGGWGSGRGLETLVEKEDSTTGSHVGSRRGSRSDGGLNDKKKSGDQDDDVSKLSVCGSGLSSRRGSKDFGGKEKGNKVYANLSNTFIFQSHLM